MSNLVRKAVTLSSDEKIERNIVGIPDEWPIETIAYSGGDVPANFVVMTTEELGNLINLHQASYNAWFSSVNNNAAYLQNYIENVISKAIAFGQKLMTEFAAQNVLLGITQAGMTATVRQRILQVIGALQTGSLYEAISAAKSIPAEDKDATFITDARLLSFVNKIETYLGITLSTTL